MHWEHFPAPVPSPSKQGQTDYQIIKDTAAHTLKEHYPHWTECCVGRYNNQHKRMVNPKKILFPPLHIKLNLVRQFVKVLAHESAAFKFFPYSLNGRMSFSIS